MDLESAARVSPLLARMPAPERRYLAKLATRAAYPAGSTIFEAEGLADHFYIIMSGSVKIRLPGQPVTIDTLGPGDLLGLSWMFPPRRWKWTATAETETDMIVFDAAQLVHECEVDERMRVIILEHLAHELERRLHQTRMLLLASETLPESQPA